MIIEFLLSLFLVGTTATVCSMTSDGIIWQIVMTSFLLGLILILGVMIFLSGYGKAFLTVFSEPKKIQNLGHKELKDVDLSISYTIKSLLYICSFFLLVSGIYFYLNFENTQTLGANLAAVLYAVFYAAFSD